MKMATCPPLLALLLAASSLLAVPPKPQAVPPKPQALPPKPQDALADTQAAKAKYDAALKVARDAEETLAPIRTAMQKAEAAAAEANKLADSKRLAATEAKNLAGDQGLKEIKRAEEGLATAEKTLQEATNSKPPLDKALEEARTAALPLQQACQAAENAAREATILAKTAEKETGKPPQPQVSGTEILQRETTAKQAAETASARRKAATEAKTALAPKAKALEEAALKALNAQEEITRAEARKKSSQEELNALKKRVEASKQNSEAEEQAARKAEAAAAPLKEEAAKTKRIYLEALKEVESKQEKAGQAKTALYRLVAARELPQIMESPQVPTRTNRIDEIVFAKLKPLSIRPVLCSDAVFIRRAYLDLTGRLPSAEEAKAFIQAQEKGKRAALIDQLLERPEHVDYWAMKWSDILKVKAEFPVKLWPNAAQAYHRWIWESIATNKPYDQFVRELLVSNGSNFRDGPVNFYRAIQERTPEGIAAAVGLATMGTRVLLWPPQRRAEMAVFFSQLGYKPTSEWKEEIVFWDPLKVAGLAGSTAAGVDSVAKAISATNLIPAALEKPLAEPGPMRVVFPDGTRTTIEPGRDPREVFAGWLIRPGNRWFAKAIVNRTWAWAMGRGIINEPDDIRAGNGPSNAELLSYLEKELVASHYNLKKLKRLIFTSSVYQFSSIRKNASPAAKANFASYPLRRIEAEVLIDILNQITGGGDLYTSAVPEPFTYIPRDMSAVELADGSVTSPFLTLFGRSSRATGMETERVNELASSQWLYLLNSAAVQGKIQTGPKLGAILSKGGKPREITEQIYLTILSRMPTESDFAAAEEYAKNGAGKPKGGKGAWADLAWALINSPEFLLRH